MNSYGNFFTWAGVVCMVLLNFGFAVFCVAYYQKVKQESYYKGLREQLLTTIDELEEAFADKQTTSFISIEYLQKVLYTLHNREYINLAYLKEESRHVEYSLVDERHNKAVLTNFPVGTKVIVRSNEPGPLLVGEVAEHVFHENSGRYDALGIKSEKDGKIFYTLNTHPLYYSDEVLAALSKLTWWEQWNVIAGGNCSMDEAEAKRKEDYTYSERKRRPDLDLSDSLAYEYSDGNIRYVDVTNNERSM